MSGRNGSIWKRVWKLKVPQRVRVFAWLMLHERLLINVERVRQHSAEVDLCDVCMHGREDIDHVLRLCIVAKGTWRRIIPPELSETFFSLPFHDWLIKNMFDSAFVPSDGE
ncbi:hypothetical protein V6N11_065298 [Hibiscus sabdariffa]|uniref:Reverse transcriptase zinc-binding domain-containing protein n=1 Tax=Hibiscus sabdariffa TaxID=183260 RepID=A0ABR2QGL0_9ROSI